MEDCVFEKIPSKIKNQLVCSDRLVIVAKEFLKLPNLHMLIKQESIIFQKLGSRDFWRIPFVENTIG